MWNQTGKALKIFLSYTPDPSVKIIDIPSRRDWLEVVQAAEFFPEGIRWLLLTLRKFRLNPNNLQSSDKTVTNHFMVYTGNPL